MRYVSLTQEQSKKVNSNKLGYTSGKRDEKTGLRSEIIFCSSLEFASVFGYDVKREFIEI